jgi:transcription elongation factor GreA
MTTSGHAADLLRDVGLLADGPVRWGRPVPGRGPGIYVVELATPLPTAPLELTKVGKWLERVPTLAFDGTHPTSKALLARLAAFWLSDATVIYVGASTASTGARVGSLVTHVLGNRRPHPDGHWLHALRGLENLRIWWAATAATEEALDAILDAFAARHTGVAPDRPAGSMTLPWANTRRPTGERQPHGITASLVPEEAARPIAPTRIVDLPPGDADGVVTEAKGSGTVRRTGMPNAVRAGAGRPASPTRRTAVPRPRVAAVPKSRATPRPRAAAAPKRFEAKREPIPLSADAMARLVAELDDLTRVRRPGVVARIKSARELGDLKENADYQAAREEQSFLEGRVRLLEDRLRFAVVLEEGPGTRVVLGSTVTVEQAGNEVTYEIVGSTDADPGAGRISTASPVGGALLGASVGDEVEVRTPRGAVRYKVLSIS